MIKFIFQNQLQFSVLIVMSASLSYVIGGLIIEKYRKYNNQTIATIVYDMWNNNINTHLYINFK